jgi:hypothetical protein
MSALDPGCSACRSSPVHGAECWDGPQHLHHAGGGSPTCVLPAPFSGSRGRHDGQRIRRALPASGVISASGVHRYAQPEMDAPAKAALLDCRRPAGSDNGNNGERIAPLRLCGSGPRVAPLQAHIRWASHRGIDCSRSGPRSGVSEFRRDRGDVIHYLGRRTRRARGSSVPRDNVSKCAHMAESVRRR